MVNITLPDQEERLELLGGRIKNLANYFMTSDDVCPVRLAELTSNFTEDELCRLVREAASWAMARCLKGNPAGLKITQDDFLNSLLAIKPRFGVQRERLMEMMPGGFFEAARPAQQLNDRDFETVTNIVNNLQAHKFLSNLCGSLTTHEIPLNKERNRRQGTRSHSSDPKSVEEAPGCSLNGSDTEFMNTSQHEDKDVGKLQENFQWLFAGHGLFQMSTDQGLICYLIEGAPKSGKSAIAARFAQQSNVPFVKVIIPEDLLDASVADKCRYIRELLEDACVSQDSIVIIDDLERLLEYVPLDKTYSNEVLQMLMVLLKKQPPRGHTLRILCTSSCRDILEDLGMMSVFTSVIHVPNLVVPDEILFVAEASQRFEQEELRAIEAAIVDKPISIGIKRLLDLITLVNPMNQEQRVPKFLEKMGDEMGWKKPVK
ncbi:hypothetical protein KR032_009904 [Drosophila birchii]|nr:hypothetical protein KR032_009904 [Drosophila birchii]